MKSRIMKAAIEVAIDQGYTQLERRKVARQADVAESLVSYYFGDVNDLKYAVILHAIKHSILPIIAQALVNHDPQALRLPANIKKKAAQSIME